MLVPVRPVPMVKLFGAAADTVNCPPRLTACPLIVIPLLTNLALAIDPANMAFVTVALSPVVTIVPFTSGTVKVLVVDAVIPDNWNCIRLVASPSSIKYVVLSLRLLFVNVCAVVLSTVVAVSMAIVTAELPL